MVLLTSVTSPTNTLLLWAKNTANTPYCVLNIQQITIPQYGITVNPVYIFGANVNYSLVHIIPKQQNIFLCNLSSKCNNFFCLWKDFSFLILHFIYCWILCFNVNVSHYRRWLYVPVVHRKKVYISSCRVVSIEESTHTPTRHLQYVLCWGAAAKLCFSPDQESDFKKI